MPTIRPWILTRATSLALLLAPSALPADECFCLTDADDAVWFDCVEFRPPLATQPTFHCRSVSIDERVVVSGDASLQRVAAGTAPCTPCRLRDAVTNEVIRGDPQDRPMTNRPIKNQPIMDQPSKNPVSKDGPSDGQAPEQPPMAATPAGGRP